MAGADDGHVVLALGPRDPVLQDAVGPGGDRIAVTEGGEERDLQGGEHLPGLTIGARCRIVGRDGDQGGELASALGIGLVGERRIVGGDDLRAQVAGAAEVDDGAGGEGLHLLGELEPSEERLGGRALAGGQEGVGGNRSLEAVWVLAQQAEPDQPPPVLTDQGHLGEVEMIEQKGTHPFDMAGVGVLGPRCRLVRATEPDQVGGDHPQPGGGQDGNHVAVEVAPRRLAVEEEDDLPVGRPLIEIVDPEGTAALIGHLGEVRRELEIGKSFETLVRGTQNLHPSSHLNRVDERNGRPGHRLTGHLRP